MIGGPFAAYSLTRPDPTKPPHRGKFYAISKRFQKFPEHDQSLFVRDAEKHDVISVQIIRHMHYCPLSVCQRHQSGPLLSLAVDRGSSRGVAHGSPDAVS